MIEITGVTEGDEFEAANHLKRKILNLWPDLARSRTDTIRMFVGLKMHGQPIEDLDLVVVGSFDEPRVFDPEWEFFPREGKPFTPKRARIRNFALVIEVKSHDATGVRFENTAAFVKYRRNGRQSWHCATEKNRAQMFEFKRWLDRFGLDEIHVQNLVYFSGLKDRDLPTRPHVCVASDTSFERILNVLGQVSGPRARTRSVTLSYGREEVFNRLLSVTNSPLFATFEPTPLDRRRMDLIAISALSDAWLEDLAQRQVLIKGRGGVGKTVMLLQLAYRAFDQRGQRSLILTYNKALVADMRRTMSLLGVPRDIERGGVTIETVHGFIGRLMMGLGIIASYEGFLDNYESNKNTLLEYIRSDAVSAEDIETLLARESEYFDWDLIFVDEGQDWPRDEIEIINSVYGALRLVITDGVDQYVRNSIADWSSELSRSNSKMRRLKECLRMKSNLASFVADVANCLGLDDWDLRPNPDAPGGKVIIYEGNLAAEPEKLAELIQEARKLGNFPVDLLACVPPGALDRGSSHRENLPAAAYQGIGGKVWDGTARDVREIYPTDRNAIRFVQYDSCRGLEGWSVVNYDLDQLWDYKIAQWSKEDHEFDPLLETAEEAAHRHAARWIMIPLTRAMDTLVISIGAHEGPIRRALHSAACRHDFVEWVKLEANVA